MKAFYYKKDVGPRSRMYGHRKVKLIVYGVNRGTLEKIGEGSYTTGVTCGDFGEVWHILKAAGRVPKTSDVFDGSRIDAYGYANKHQIIIKDLDDLY